MRSASLLALLVSAGCAATRPQVPTTAPLVVGSGSGPTTTATAPDIGRPAGVAAWLHAERVDTLVDLLGSLPAAARLAPALASIDTGQNVDVVLTASADTRKLYDLVPVLRFHVRDAKALVAIAEQELDVREDGDRIYARPRGAPEDDRYACVLSHTDTAVCSTLDGVGRFGAWLADVQPPPGPAAQLIVYGPTTARLLADGGELGALAAEVDTITIDLAETRRDAYAVRASLRLVPRGPVAQRLRQVETQLAAHPPPPSVGVAAAADGSRLVVNVSLAGTREALQAMVEGDALWAWTKAMTYGLAIH